LPSMMIAIWRGIPLVPGMVRVELGGSEGDIGMDTSVAGKNVASEGRTRRERTK
jgi:hypothetical protein